MCIDVPSWTPRYPRALVSLCVPAEKLVTMKLSVTPQARDVLLEVFAREGITFGALMESYAEAVEMEGGVPAELSRKTLLDRARLITAERRKRSVRD